MSDIGKTICFGVFDASNMGFSINGLTKKRYL